MVEPWALRARGSTIIEKLYTSEELFSEEKYDEFIQGLEIKRLSNEDRDNLEGPLAYEECKRVLDSFESDKSPGEDGFTTEFYKFFFLNYWAKIYWHV